MAARILRAADFEGVIHATNHATSQIAPRARDAI